MDYRDYRKKYGSTHAETRKSTVNASGMTAARAENNVRKKRPVQTMSTTKTGMSYINSKKKYKYGRKKEGGQFILIAIVMLTVIMLTIIGVLIGTGLANRLPNYIPSKVSVEAGSRKSIDANDFIMDKSHTAEFHSSTSYSLNHVGKYQIKLVVDGEKTYKTQLVVTDSVSPTATAVTPSVRVGGSIKAENCVTNIKDATNVTCAFLSKPDISAVGTVDVVVRLTDEGGNTVEIPSTINVVENAAVVNSVAIIECGESIPDVSVYVGIDGSGEYVTDSTVNTSVPGYKKLTIRIGSDDFEVTLICKDTIAPTATVTPQVLWNDGNFPDPATFCSDIVDKTAVTVTYDVTPKKTGTYPVDVKIRLTDAAGNYTVYDSYVTAGSDTVAPVITLKQKTLSMKYGETSIAWQGAVSATDDSGYDPVITIDTSAVNFNLPGSYTITFRATDPAGNIATATATLNIQSDTVTQEMLDAVLKDFCSSLFTDGMTILQKMETLWSYLRSNRSDRVHYASADPEIYDPVRETYLALTTRKNGDCYCFASIAYEVFRYLGYDSIIVEKDPKYAATTGRHYWTMINLGTATNPSWYHFDGTPITYPYNQSRNFALTDEQMAAFTKWRNADTRMEPAYYYAFDTTKYPASSKTIILAANIPSQYFD